MSFQGARNLSSFHLNEALKMQDERDELRQVISNFCEENNWAVDAWKNQGHIKPLFDIHAKTKEAK